ncbi:MAG: hypothetical protein ABIW76_20320 [Fibrobacteria bacterium]
MFFDNAERRKNDEFYFGVWHLAVQGGNLYFADYDTLSRKPLSSGAAVKADQFAFFAQDIRGYGAYLDRSRGHSGGAATIR